MASKKNQVSRKESNDKIAKQFDFFENVYDGVSSLSLERYPLIFTSSMEILKFKNLKYLSINIKYLPDLKFLRDLKKLKKIRLINAYKTDLSILLGLTLDEISIEFATEYSLNSFCKGVRSNLKILEIRYTEISSFSFLEPFSKLEKLKINYSEIQNISLLLQIKKNIPILDFSNCNLSHISLNVFQYFDNYNFFYEDFKEVLSEEPKILLFGNPFFDSLINVLNLGNRNDLHEYLNSIEKEAVKINEVKMIFLGEPRAGKTTLQKYLMGQNIDIFEPTTPDIKISYWYPFVFQNHDKRDLKINLWDFGGQEIQYSLHKFFMTEDTLYVIVLDSTKDQSPLNYLEFLENYAPGVPFIVINNYADVATSHSLKLDENYLQENYNGINGKPVLKGLFSRVSVLKAAENDPPWQKIMVEIENRIKEVILELPNLNKAFPKEYLDVKVEIEKIYQEPGRHYMTMSFFREICKNLKITDTEDRRLAILKYLNQLGTLRYFGDTDFSDKHILNPKWLIEGAYALLINRITEENNGVLTKKQAYEILNMSSQFTFYEEECEYIFKIMNSFGMLHFDQFEGQIYIPLRFSSKQPISLTEFYSNSKKIVFDFESDIPNDIIATLIVKHFSEIKNKLFWIKGAIFQDQDIRILVKVEDRQIQFYLKGDFPQIYFEILRNSLKKTLGILPGLVYSESIEFEYLGKKIVAEYENLILTLKEKLDYYFDYDQKIKVKTEDIPRILGGYYSEKEITDGITVHGNYFHVERYYQTNNTFLNQIEQLNEASKDESLKKELESLKAELIQLSSLKEKVEKTGFGKKVLKRIKNLSETATEEAVKEGVKQLFPKAIEFFSKIESVSFEDINSVFQQIFSN